MQAPAFTRLEANQGLTVAVGAPEKLDRYVRGEAARWHNVIQAAHIEPQ